MTATIAEIRRYPVKSLGGEVLPETVLEPGRGLAGDRRYAMVPADAAEPAEGWRPKSRCVAMVRHAPLARVSARYEEATDTLVLAAGGRELARGRVEADVDRVRLEAALDRDLAADVGTRLKLVSAGADGMIGDVDAPFLSLINLASARALGAALDAAVDPVRFRGNLHLDGVPAWAEQAWPGRRFALGGAVLEIVEPIGRCAATEVNPDTTVRDLHILKGLATNFGHTRMGAYAIVVSGGALTRGAELREID